MIPTAIHVPPIVNVSRGRPSQMAEQAITPKAGGRKSFIKELTVFFSDLK